ncbi:hypothetical protein E0765_06185 [Sulfuricurvum sp. IAE1]|uniref:hypothetical protein n=1 Tax=Sulfuricurvum sp. IAE1 TaxID=2546102 RepID=UPI001044B7C8|nr:hypothetical protein [Sulfuricurvum sp. IAE1]TDA64301.1 hypothetical protein E0765_06185 [Sulfuricurvum sp. IAE1]
MEGLLKLIPVGRHYSVIIFLSALFLLFALFNENVYVDRFSLVAISLAGLLFGISEMINHSDEKQYKPYFNHWTNETTQIPDGIKHVRKMTILGSSILGAAIVIMITGLYHISTL